MQHHKLPTVPKSIELPIELHRWHTANREVDRVIARELKFQPTLKRLSGRRSTRLQKLVALRNLYLSRARKDWPWEEVASMLEHVVDIERWIFRNVESANPASIPVELLQLATEERESSTDEISSVCDWCRERSSVRYRSS